MRRVIILWNRKAGMAGDQEERLREAFRRADLNGEIRPVSGPQLRGEAEQALRSNAEVVAAAGGDGTINTVAGVVAGSNKLLGVLPMGTLNHFAKDLGLPLDLDEALQVLGKGEPKKVDLAEVNGRVFLNSSALGLYPLMVRDRDDQRKRLGRHKWLAMLWAAFNIFRRFPTMTLRLETRADSAHLATPLVFVGNNRYEMDIFSVKGRTCLDEGLMSLYLVKSTRRLDMVRLGFRALFGALRQDRDFSSQCLKEFWVESRRRHLDVALDGEVVRLKPPLHYRTRPGALQVIRPVKVEEPKTDSPPEETAGLAALGVTSSATG